MRLVRIWISAITLAAGALVVSATSTGAATPCAPGQPPGRPPGRPPGQPGPPPGRPPQYPPGKCQLLLSTAATPPGKSISAAGAGYAPGSAVAMRLNATPVGTASADGNGTFIQSFTVPVDTAPGQYDVRATGVGVGGSAYEQSATLQVLPVQAQQQAGGQPQQASNRPILIPGLRSGAGLAAAPQRDDAQLNGGTGLAPGAVVGGGLTVLPGGTTGQAGTGATSGLLGSDATVAPEQAVPGIALSGPSSSGGVNALVAVGGGLLLAGIGAGIVIAARRRRSSTS